MKITLRRGQRLFIAGAVLRTDRRVSLDLLNNVAFLLENHFLEEKDAATPLERLYLSLQSAFLAQGSREDALRLCRAMLTAPSLRDGDPRLPGGLIATLRCIEEDRLLDAMKTLRGLFAPEAKGLEARHQAQTLEVA